MSIAEVKVEIGAYGDKWVVSAKVRVEEGNNISRAFVVHDEFFNREAAEAFVRENAKEWIQGKRGRRGSARPAPMHNLSDLKSRLFGKE